MYIYTCIHVTNQSRRIEHICNVFQSSVTLLSVYIREKNSQLWHVNVRLKAYNFQSAQKTIYIRHLLGHFENQKLKRFLFRAVSYRLKEAGLEQEPKKREKRLLFDIIPDCRNSTWY